jgi:hypothetical protein
VVELDRAAEDIAFAWPSFLPDGRHFLYQIVSLDPARTGSYIGDLDGTESVRVLDTESPAVFAAPRYLLHVQRDMLIAEEFDLHSLRLTGRATLLARGVSPPSLSNDNVVSAVDGLVAFQHRMKERNLVWLDRSGEILSTMSTPIALFNPRISPEGSRLLATSSVTSDPGLWLASLERTEFQRLAADAIAPLWAPEGRRIAYTARGGLDLYIGGLRADSAGEPLVSDDSVKFLNDWSPDGAHLIYTRLDEQSRLDLWRLGVHDGADTPLLATPFNEMQARISPDGRWLAYVSDETGAAELCVAPYPEMDRRHLVSSGGGGQPQWRADQEELFYMAPDRSIVAVDVNTSASEAISFGAPRRLFRAPAGGDLQDARDHYAVADNGTKFLVDGAVGQGDGTAITVIVTLGSQSAEPSRVGTPTTELLSRADR